MNESRYLIRTDLALETQEKCEKSGSLIHGLNREEEQMKGDIKVTTVQIETENAAKIMGKPRGTYITIEAPQMEEEDGGYHRDIAEELANRITMLLPLENPTQNPWNILIVGLGNREVTPDALGPKVIDNLYVTRHIIREFGKYAFGDANTCRISAIAPGVMAQTGMESVEILKGIVEQTKPDVVVTIDALAARSTKRLGRTIQLTDTGITPGSGVGNHRNALNRESLGVPVISIGVPTVVDAATIVMDALSEYMENLPEELLSPKLYGMFVTPKNIDDSVKHVSFLISEALHIAFLGNSEEEEHI